MKGILSAAPPSPTRPASNRMSEPYPMDAATRFPVTSLSCVVSSSLTLNVRNDTPGNHTREDERMGPRQKPLLHPLLLSGAESDLDDSMRVSQMEGWKAGLVGRPDLTAE